MWKCVHIQPLESLSSPPSLALGSLCGGRGPQANANSVRWFFYNFFLIIIKHLELGISYRPEFIENDAKVLGQ